MGDSRKGVIESKLQQKPLESKKAIYALFASISVLLVFVGSALLILKHAEVAREIVELATTSIMAFMALAVTLITGQSAFDWKAVSALQHMDVDSDAHESIQSNQPIGEVDISHVRSPKDFLRDSPF
jgi:nitrate reductase gamma subunit